LSGLAQRGYVQFSRVGVREKKGNLRERRCRSYVKKFSERATRTHGPVLRHFWRREDAGAKMAVSIGRKEELLGPSCPAKTSKLL